MADGRCLQQNAPAEAEAGNQDLDRGKVAERLRCASKLGCTDAVRCSDDAMAALRGLLGKAR